MPFSSFSHSASDLRKALYRLPGGEHREMSIIEAIELDSPEGTVVVTLSATLYRMLVEHHESLMIST